MTKIYEQDLQDAITDSEALKTKKVNGNPLPKNHVSKVRNLASFILAKKRSLSSPSVSHLMVENCYNTFKQRQDYTESTQRTVEEKKEPEYEAIGSLEEVMAAADYTVSSVIKDYKDNGKEAALWTVDPEQAEIPQKIKDLIEDPNKKEPFEIWKAKDENFQMIQPTEWVFAGATIGDSVKTLTEAAGLFTTLTDKKASWAKKIIATLGWLFKLSNGVIGSITEVQKVSGAEQVLDFPFLSLGTSLTNLAEKIRLYINARAAWNKEKADVAEKDKRNPAKKLEESLAFWDMMDDGIDLLQSIASTVLYILAPMTAGLSQVVNTAMKLVVCWIHIGLGHWKLHVINKMKDRIVTYYENERKKQSTEWDEFRGKLVSQKCGQVHTLIKTFIEKEFDEIEDALENTQGWVNNIATNTQMTDDNVKQNVEKILTVVCNSDPENCLEFVNRLKLDLKTIRNLNSETGEKVYTISKWTKFGPINSAYMVTKIYVENIFENDDFKNYVANAQNKLLIHGYYPTFQTYQYDLFTCRLCGNPYYQLDRVDFGVEFTSLLSKIVDITPTGIKTGKSVIQESVETYSKTDRENEITRYFVAHFAEIKPEGWREFTASNIVPLPGKDDLDHKFILEEGDFMESLNHDHLSICTTKLKRLEGLLKIIKRNQEAAAKLREELKRTGGNWGVEGSLSILQTVYSNNEYEKGGKAHQFAHVLISHMADKFSLTNVEKEKTNCVLIDGIFAIRHHHFSLHIARNSATVKDGDENKGNIPEESLKTGGWSLFKGPLEMTYFEKRNIFVKDKTYRWALNIYSKEVLNLRAATTTGVAQISFLKQTLDNIYELKDTLKREFIQSLTQLYCVDECSSFDSTNPLTFTRSTIFSNISVNKIPKKLSTTKVKPTLLYLIRWNFANWPRHLLTFSANSLKKKLIF